MNLYAYAQIEDLNQVLRDNNICIPRLRGLMLMSEEKPYEDYSDCLKSIAVETVRDACHCEFDFNSCVYTYNKRTRDLEKKLLKNDNICWDKIHGKKRNRLKLEIKHRIRDFKLQNDTFNSFCGNPNVLYIHARIGGGNWTYYGGPALEKQPWFICKIDDCYDSTYCDIYARIGDLNEN